MKFLNAPRQPFVGLSLMAAIGIVIGDVFPVPSGGFDCGDDHPDSLHCDRRVSTHTARDLRHRWIRFFPPAQP